MNEYDTNRIFDTVREIGFVKTENLDESNCYLLNTCHIRDKAKEKVYHEIGRVKKNFRSRKKPIVIVAGCVAQAEGDILLKRDKYIDRLEKKYVTPPEGYKKAAKYVPIPKDSDFKAAGFVPFNGNDVVEIKSRRPFGTKKEISCIKT